MLQDYFDIGGERCCDEIDMIGSGLCYLVRQNCVLYEEERSGLE